MIIKLKRGLPVSHTGIRRLARRLNIPHPRSVSLSQAKNNLRAANLRYRDLKATTAKLLRKEFLQLRFNNKKLSLEDKKHIERQLKNEAERDVF